MAAAGSNSPLSGYKPDLCENPPTMPGPEERPTPGSGPSVSHLPSLGAAIPSDCARVFQALVRSSEGARRRISSSEGLGDLTDQRKETSRLTQVNGCFRPDWPRFHPQPVLDRQSTRAPNLYRKRSPAKRASTRPRRAGSRRGWIGARGYPRLGGRVGVRIPARAPACPSAWEAHGYAGSRSTGRPPRARIPAGAAAGTRAGATLGARPRAP